MSEKVMRRVMVKALTPLCGFAVENLCHPGTPDVFYIGGCIECKQADKWPVRHTTPVRFKAVFKKEQRLFLRKWHRNGGSCWVMCQIGQEWLLFCGNVAANLLGTLTQEQMYASAHEVWSSKRQMEKELVACLSKPVN